MKLWTIGKNLQDVFDENGTSVCQCHFYEHAKLIVDAVNEKRARDHGPRAESAREEEAKSEL